MDFSKFLDYLRFSSLLGSIFIYKVKCVTAKKSMLHHGDFTSAFILALFLIALFFDLLNNLETLYN